MKKTYIAPEMEMIDIKLENMIAASVFKDAVDPKNSEAKELQDFEEFEVDRCYIIDMSGDLAFKKNCLEEERVDCDDPVINEVITNVLSSMKINNQKFDFCWKLFNLV